MPESDFNSGPGHRWLVLSLVMMGTFMAILDSSIVNVALPHMMSAFGVNRNQIEWVSTGFMLATAVAMPLVGFLVGRLGHKTLYLTSLALFTLGSAACALAWSYNSLIAARVIQAVGGGAIQPVGMAIVADLFEPEERGRALGIWGTGIMVGPAIGPTLGGYLTEIFSWRSIFSVNLPVGVATFLAAMIIMKKPEPGSRHKTVFDWWGFLFLSLALIAGLLALSKGQEKGWTSQYILVCLAGAVIGLTMFITVESILPHPLLDLRLFLHRNFSLSMILAVFRAVGLFGGVFLLPIFLENLVGYTTIQTGLWMMPGAVTIGIMMPISGRLADLYSPRWLVTAGSLITGASLAMYGGLDPRSSATMIIIPQIFRGAGLALMMAPLLTAAINSVPREQVATASSFLNVAQRVGGAFGIALLNTYVTDAVHVHGVRLGEKLGLATHGLHRLAEVAARVQLDLPGLAATNQVKAAYLAVQSISQNAQVLAFDNGFVVAGCIILLGTPFCLFLENIRAKKLEKAAG